MTLINKCVKYLFRIPTKYCPLCNSHDIDFLPLPASYEENAKKYGYKYFGKGEMTSLKTYSCSNCGASDRERLYAHWIFDVVEKDTLIGKRFLHFAPELQLSLRLKELLLDDYKTADLEMVGCDFSVDLMNLPFEDNSVDFFICSHVLEHVPSDKKAISELFRVTKKNGKGILMAPISVGLKSTIENSNITSFEERWKHFGQGDHLRLYAHDDFINKIKDSGFKVSELGLEYFGKKMFKKLGLKKTSILYIVEKE